MKINKIANFDSGYTLPLAYVDPIPKQLFVLGALPDERRPTIAIVGTRKPTSYGREVTERFSRALAARGIVIVSGLAIGVDSLAHRAAIEAGGVTIGVVANALPQIYPATNRQLAQDMITHRGAVVSEHGPDQHYQVGKWSFLERNRIVAGLSDGILITEASAGSGTINTASHALAQGKEVFVVPGNITSPMSSGCNKLIQQGAHLVTTPEDIIEIIMPTAATTQTALPLGANQLENDIIALISRGNNDGDDMQAALGIGYAELSATLTMLEINGSIKALGANRWALR